MPWCNFQFLHRPDDPPLTDRLVENATHRPLHLSNPIPYGPSRRILEDGGDAPTLLCRIDRWGNRNGATEKAFERSIVARERTKENTGKKRWGTAVTFWYAKPVIRTVSHKDKLPLLDRGWHLAIGKMIEVSVGHRHYGRPRGPHLPAYPIPYCASSVTTSIHSDKMPGLTTSMHRSWIGFQ